MYKLAIGFKLIDGPWGGSQQFTRSIADFLKKKGWSVVFDLKSRDIDLILLTDPRKNSLSASFSSEDIRNYLKKKPDTVVVHRINECDERKGTSHVNSQLMEGNEIADHTIFISDWLRALFSVYKPFNKLNSSVVRNGGDEKTFSKSTYKKWDGIEPLKLVTHHFGGHWLKGFDIYSIIDDIASNGINGVKVNFTYIGNIAEGFEFKNSKVMEPLNGKALADNIACNHIYLTGSQNEPGGMHHIEGCLCGLPPLYRVSGALTEHCKDFGVGFDGPEDFISALERMISNYGDFAGKMENYPYNSHLMCENYEKVFLGLLEKKSTIFENRPFQIKRPLWRRLLNI